MTYRLTCNGEERTLASQDVLENCFKEIRKRGGGELWVAKVDGELRGFERFVYRLLGLNTEVESASIGLLYNGERAFLTFLDDAADEFVGLTRGAVEERGVLRFSPASGEFTDVPASDCISLDAACEAVRHFHAHGSRTASLRWRKTE